MYGAVGRLYVFKYGDGEAECDEGCVIYTRWKLLRIAEMVRIVVFGSRAIRIQVVFSRLKGVPSYVGSNSEIAATYVVVVTEIGTEVSAGGNAMAC